jgi:gliding motility-associated-like protein
MVTTADGCTDDAVVTVQVDAAPALGADQTAATCEGTPFDLTPLYTTNGIAVQWTLGGAPVADPAAVTQAGAYQLVVTNSFNCTDTALVNYTVNANPDLGGDLNFSLCPWQSVDLGAVFAVDGLDADYTFNGQPVADPTAVTEEGVYTVTVTDANGCMDSATANVVPIECLCVADFTADARCLQDPVLFTLAADSAVVGARWDFGGTAVPSNAIDPVVLFFPGHEEVVVTLEATLSCGVITVQRTISVPDCSDSCSVYVPSAFTPNGDKVNEVWSWTSECEPTEFEVIVFNRWGEEVFSTTDPYSSWDGTSRGAMAPDGLYLFRMGYRLPYQDRKQVQGLVVLLR